METISLMVIQNNGRIIDIVETEEWEYIGDEYDLPYDQVDEAIVPKELWENDEINNKNVKEYLVL